MKRIEDYLSLINTARSAQETFDVFVGIMRDYGYDRVAYGFATDHPSLNLKRMHGHMNSFPEDWMKHYAENQLLDIDPIPARMLKSPLPAFWANVNADPNLPDQSRQFMQEAGEVGLKEGVLVPLYGLGGEIAGVSVSCAYDDRDKSYESLAAIQLLSVYFHEAYKNFIKKNVAIELTEKEHEILIWAADGKTDEDIAAIINKSVPTVRYHWKNIFKKLDAYSRIYAISKAIRLQLISPYAVIKNYQN